MRVHVLLLGGGELSAYAEGAAASKEWLGQWYETWTLTFTNVVDFGPGVRQRVRVVVMQATDILYAPCNWTFTNFADVIPGQTVSAGEIRPGSASSATECLYASYPSWRADGTRVAFLRSSERKFVYQNDICETAALPPPLVDGNRLFAHSGLIKNIAMVAYGPPARANDLLVLENGGLSDHLYIGPSDDLTQMRHVPAKCSGEYGAIAHYITFLAWHGCRMAPASSFRTTTIAVSVLQGAPSIGMTSSREGSVKSSGLTMD